MKNSPFIAVKAFVFLMIGTSTHAAFVRPLNDKQVIEAPIASQDLTRITVENDRITDVFGIAGEYALEADESRGQIFIRPLGPFLSGGGFKPIHLTLTTEEGHTQDLRLVPQDGPPEALILTADNAKEQSIQASVSREEVENLIQASKDERIPLRYKLMPRDLKTLKGPHVLLKELRGEKLRCLTYEIKNKTKTLLTLSEPEFAQKYASQLVGLRKENLIALFMPKKTLQPGEGTAVYVVARTLP